MQIDLAVETPEVRAPRIVWSPRVRLGQISVGFEGVPDRIGV